MSEAQVRPLLPTGHGSGVLVTGRKVLRGLEGVHHVQLDVLSTDEATTLLGRVAGAAAVGAEPEAAQVARLCGHLPLALRIAASRMVGRSHVTMDRLVQRLASDGHRLNELAAGDLAVRDSIERGYRDLPREARRAFRRLGFLRAPAVSPAVAASALGRPRHVAERLLDELADRHMLLPVVPPRASIAYTFHDLLRLYARERCVAEDGPGERAATVRRAAETWAAAAAESLAAGVATEPRDWLEAEHEAIVATCVQAGELGLDDAAHALASVVESAHELFERLGDEAGAACSAAALGAIRRSVGTPRSRPG